MDKRERQAHRVIKTTIKHWRGYVLRQKARRVVLGAMEQAVVDGTHNMAVVDETTRLLPPA
jgi:hypothetical protein